MSLVLRLVTAMGFPCQSAGCNLSFNNSKQLTLHRLTAHTAPSAGPPSLSRLTSRTHPTVAARYLLNNEDDDQTDRDGHGADDEPYSNESEQLSALARLSAFRETLWNINHEVTFLCTRIMRLAQKTIVIHWPPPTLHP